jgi:hydroxymethylpyrimidine pyrophosphatase-like HAD family hydrolase
VPRIRLVAIDLDGTLLRSDHTISDRSRSAIRAARKAGIGVTVVTARSPRSVRHIAREAGLNGLAICANGAAVFDLDEGRIDLHTPLRQDVAQRLVTGMRSLVPGPRDRRGDAAVGGPRRRAGEPSPVRAGSGRRDHRLQRR